MKIYKRGLRGALAVGLLFTLLAACTNLSSAPAAEVTASVQKRGVTNWQDEVIYFALTDRFANGDVKNDNGAPGAADDAEPTNPRSAGTAATLPVSPRRSRRATLKSWALLPSGSARWCSKFRLFR